MRVDPDAHEGHPAHPLVTRPPVETPGAADPVQRRARDPEVAPRQDEREVQPRAGAGDALEHVDGDGLVGKGSQDGRRGARCRDRAADRDPCHVEVVGDAGEGWTLQRALRQLARRIGDPGAGAAGQRAQVLAIGQRVQAMSDVTDDKAALNAGVDAVQASYTRTSFAELSRAARSISAPAMVWASGLLGYSFCRGPSKTLPPSTILPRRLPALPEMPHSLSKRS